MRFLLSACFLSLLFLAPFRSAHAENPTTLGFGCAPWDGPALHMSIGAPDISINIDIWAHGYDALSKGERTIHIDNKWADGTGRATIEDIRLQHDKSYIPPPADVTVHFNTLDFKEGGKASGYVEDSHGMKWPFEGVISKPGIPCG